MLLARLVADMRNGPTYCACPSIFLWFCNLSVRYTCDPALVSYGSFLSFKAFRSIPVPFAHLISFSNKSLFPPTRFFFFSVIISAVVLISSRPPKPKVRKSDFQSPNNRIICLHETACTKILDPPSSLTPARQVHQTQCSPPSALLQESHYLELLTSPQSVSQS